MKKLILVRYGSWENGHLNEEGKQTMADTAQKLESFAVGSFVVIAGAVDRAIESANIIAAHFGLPTVQSFPELYAAEEDGHSPNLAAATQVITQLGSQYDTVIAVVSREYIETLPAHILHNVLGVERPAEPTNLDRGELLAVDYEAKTITIHQHELRDLISHDIKV